MKKPLNEQEIVDRATAKARRWFWFKVVVLILVVAFFLVLIGFKESRF